MNGFEQSWKMRLVGEMHTLAGNLQHCNNALQLRKQLIKLMGIELQLTDLIAEVESEQSPRIEDVWGLS